MSGLSWNPQQAILPGVVASSVGPSLAVFGTLYAAWRGGGDDEQIWYSHFDGSSWAPPRVILPGIESVIAPSSVGPSLATLFTEGGPLYAAWKGGGDDERIWYSRFAGFDGIGGLIWASPQVILPGFAASSVRPSLAVFNDRFYAAWKGGGSDERIWWSSFDVEPVTEDRAPSWAPQQVILPGVVASSVGPSLALFNGRLYGAWKGGGSDERIWWSSFDGSSWAPQQVILPGVVASSVGPSLAAFNGRLYAAWKGGGSDERIWWSSFDGSSWAPQQVILPGVVASSVGPSLAAFNGRLYAAWKGGGSDETIWWSVAVLS